MTNQTIMVKFSKENQPQNRREPSGEAKVLYTTRIKPHTKEYLKSHNVNGGKVIDEYVQEKEK